MNKTYAIIIAVLVLIAAGLSFLIFEGSSGRVESPSHTATTSESMIDGSPMPEVPKNPNLTEEEKKLFLQEGFATTTSLKPGEYISKVASLAVEADEIVMNDCRPEPLIIRIAGGKTATFKNAGTDKISININKSQPLIIEPGQIASTMKLNAGPQLHSRIAITYKCDGWNAGIIYVSNASPAAR